MVVFSERQFEAQQASTNPAKKSQIYCATFGQKKPNKMSCLLMTVCQTFMKFFATTTTFQNYIQHMYT